MGVVHVQIDTGFHQLVIGDGRQVSLLGSAGVHDLHLIAGGSHVVAALPLGRVHVPQHQAALTAIGVLVPGIELAGAASLDDIALLQKARLQLGTHHIGRGCWRIGRRTRHGGEQLIVAAARGFHVFHHEEGRIRPALDEFPVHKIVLQDNVLPAQGQRTVGAGAQVQPVIGLFARAGQTRVDADVHIGIVHLVDQVTAAVVVVRVLRRGTPLNIDPRAVTQRHPRSAVHRGDGAHEAARPLADFRSHMGVGSIEQPLVETVGAVNPLARRTAHVEYGLAAVLIDDLRELLTDGVHGLVPRDAHPAGVFALGVRSLQRMIDTIGMVGRLNGRLALAAVIARRLERRLVALAFDRTTVLHGDPHAALHLAATATAGADALDLASAAGRLGVLGQGGTGHRAADNGRSSRGCGELGEGAPAQIELAHLSSFSYSPRSPASRLSAPTSCQKKASTTSYICHYF